MPQLISSMKSVIPLCHGNVILTSLSKVSFVKLFLLLVSIIILRFFHNRKDRISPCSKHGMASSSGKYTCTDDNSSASKNEITLSTTCVLGKIARSDPAQKMHFTLQQHDATQSCNDLRNIFPRKYERLGSVVVVRLNRGMTECQFSKYASCFAESFAPQPIQAVLIDAAGITGELRQPVMNTVYTNVQIWQSVREKTIAFLEKSWLREKDVLCGTFLKDDAMFYSILNKCAESITFSTHIENGIRYSFDVRRAMFCSGNTTERMHFGKLKATDETVVDMFCGIGYFAIPLARYGYIKKIYALEKNPDSAAYLKLNAIQNGVAHKLNVLCGDNRVIGDELIGTCDRVIMGYIPSCKSFLSRALSFLRCDVNDEPRGVIHYHYLASKKSGKAVVEQHMRDELHNSVVTRTHIQAIRRVKCYSPKNYHFVADIVVEDNK